MMFAAIGGGIATLSVMAPFGAVVASICAPIGGSLSAVLAAAYLTRRHGEARSEVDLDAQADTMVATLRELAARGAEPRTEATSSTTDEVDRARAG